MTGVGAAVDRHVLHVDMDAFYAAVEQRDNKRLQGKPLVVGGGNVRGVVAAASYEARTYGIRSAMPMREALRRCPVLLRVAPRMSLYKQESDKVFAIFREFTPLVEGLSLDEAFLDITASRSLFGQPQEIALQIKKRIVEQTSLTASVGVATNKLVAKIASDLDKPDGLVVITAENLRSTLDPLPVKVIPGIGRETLRRLCGVGIESILQLRKASNSELEPVFGRFTQTMRNKAAGIDDRAVIPFSADKSMSAEHTFDVDLRSPEAMHRELLRLSDRTASRVRSKQLLAGTVQVKIRMADFSTFTRQRALKPPADSTDQVFAAARSLLNSWLSEHKGARIRLLGVGCSGFSQSGQGDLFAADSEPAKTKVDNAVDRIRDRFGTTAVNRARTINE